LGLVDGGAGKKYRLGDIADKFTRDIFSTTNRCYQICS